MEKGLKTGGDKNSGLASIALPGRRLATSKNPRMLTPSEIDLLQQDLKVATWVVEPDEIDDARELIALRGLSADDFEFSQRADPTPNFPTPITGTITLTRKSNGATKTYTAGHCSDWLVRLEADLKAGVFTSI